MQHLIGLALLVWFWLTPIVYPGGLVYRLLEARSRTWLCTSSSEPDDRLVFGFQKALFRTPPPGADPARPR